MKITFTAYGHIQTATADGIQTFEYQPGETVTVDAEVAAMFIESGVAIPAAVERAVKPKGETATKRTK